MAKRDIQRQLAVLTDKELDALGLIRKARMRSFIDDRSQLLKEGRVFIDCKRDNKVYKTIDLGTNTLTYNFRIYVARILARTETQVQGEVALATFPGDEGFLSTAPRFPVRLYVGTASSPALPTDTLLGNYLLDVDAVGGLPLYYDLSRVVVYDTKLEYDNLAQPINVAFEFDIPDGELRSAPNQETTPYLLREFGLYDGSQTGNAHPIVAATSAVPPALDPQTADPSGPVLLARKVADVLKLFEMSLTVRWEIRT
jgi:hypothetical protein